MDKSTDRRKIFVLGIIVCYRSLTSCLSKNNSASRRIKEDTKTRISSTFYTPCTRRPGRWNTEKKWSLSFSCHILHFAGTVGHNLPFYSRPSGSYAAWLLTVTKPTNIWYQTSDDAKWSRACCLSITPFTATGQDPSLKKITSWGKTPKP